MNNTYFLDLDGTIFPCYKHGHANNFHKIELLPGVKKAFQQMYNNDDCVILTTAREEKCRQQTIEQIAKANLYYHHLIMGVGHGYRFVINDHCENEPYRAYAIPTLRDSGNWTELL
jgi:hypothetical protein